MKRGVRSYSDKSFSGWIETNNKYNYYKNNNNNTFNNKSTTMTGSSTNDSDLRIPKLAFSEINLGRVVGTGGFSVVSEIKSIDLDEIYDIDENSAKLRKQFSKALRNGGKYVLKTLRTDLPDEEYEKGITDLAIESAFLQVLDHPHIISMRGAAQSDPMKSRYFVILDLLSITLDKKFNLWRRVVSENTGYWIPCYGYCCSNEAILHENWKDRLQCAADIASALDYLHNHGICYRDLKPDNIGFDSSGTLKVYDLGLAKRLDDAEKTENDTYLMTGNTGSLRYMAPEVAKDEPYNLSVDSYSYGILFWQICSLTTPYAGFSQAMHAVQVVDMGIRPKPDKSWPHSWVDLMTSAWHVNPLNRPNSKEITQRVDEMVRSMSEDEGIVPTRYTEIKAKKKRKKVSHENQILDVDTRKNEVIINGLPKRTTGDHNIV